MTQARIIATHYEGGAPKYEAGKTYPINDTIKVMIARGFAEEVAGDAGADTADEQAPAAIAPADEQTGDESGLADDQADDAGGGAADAQDGGTEDESFAAVKPAAGRRGRRRG